MIYSALGLGSNKCAMGNVGVQRKRLRFPVVITTVITGTNPPSNITTGGPIIRAAIVNIVHAYTFTEKCSGHLIYVAALNVCAVIDL